MMITGETTIKAPYQRCGKVGRNPNILFTGILPQTNGIVQWQVMT